MTETSVPTALYHVYGDEDLLLYIGVSNNFGRRWTEHAKKQPWWPDLRRQTVLWYPSRPEAEDAEEAAIKAEKPRYNIVHNRAVAGRIRRGPVRNIKDIPGRDLPTSVEGTWIPVRIPDGENAPVGLLDFPMPRGARRPSHFTCAERTLSDVATVEAMLAEMPEKQRECARLKIECWRLEYEIISALWKSLDDLNALAADCEGRPRILVAIRDARADIRRRLGIPCPCCKDTPPAGMTCQECGGAGRAYASPRRGYPAIASAGSAA